MLINLTPEEKKERNHDAKVAAIVLIGLGFLYVVLQMYKQTLTQ